MGTRRWAGPVAVALAVVAPPLIVFVFPAIALVGHNIEYFPQGYATGRPLYLAAAAFLAAGLVLTATARGRVMRFLAACYLLSGPAWFVHALALNAVGSVVVTAAVVVAWVLAAARVTTVPRPILLRYLGAIAAALVLGSGLPALSAMQDAAADSGADGGAPAPGAATPDLPNIYHLIFDEYQTDIFEHLLDDRVRHALRGFSFYPDTTATFGRTEMALPSMFGSDDYAYDRTRADYVAQAFHGRGSTLGVLRDLGYHRSGYLHEPGMLGDPPALDAWVVHDELAATAPMAGYSDLLVSMWIYRHTTERVSRHLLPAHHYQQLTADALLPEHAPPRSVVSVRDLIRREADLPARGRYTFAHLIVPHFPNVLQPDCTYVPGQSTGPIEQAACANHLMVEFVERLRDLGRLEDSIVVIQSDHGSWFEVVDGAAVAQRDDGMFSERASRARARALLLVHLPGAAAATAEELEVVDRPTTLDDVMPTVFDELGVEHTFTGNRLSLLEEPPADRERFYHFFKGRQRPMARYRIEGGQARFDQEFPVP